MVLRLNITMQTTACTDRVVGDILSSWRYDISGITPEMRRDYEQHLVECHHCCSRQRLHRFIDVALIGLSTLSIGTFLLGLAAIHRIQPLQHWALVDLHLWQMSFVLSLQAAAIAGSARLAPDVGPGSRNHPGARLHRGSRPGPGACSAGSYSRRITGAPDEKRSLANSWSLRMFAQLCRMQGSSDSRSH